MNVLLEPAFYVTLALFIFIAIVIWQQIPAMVTKALDARAADIKGRLDAAEGLRREAEALLKTQTAKKEAAEREAAAIIQAARDEALRIALDARRSAEEQIRRRTDAAIAKIAQSELQAIAEVRGMVADISTAVAGRLIAADMDDAQADALIADGVRDISAKLGKIAG